MRTVTWKGEDEDHRTQDGSGAGPSFTTCWGKKFPKDVAVTVDDETILRKAGANRYFSVSDTVEVLADDAVPVRRGPGRPPKLVTADVDE